MPRITFVYPRKTEALSITNRSCALNCAHCRGHYLKHMKSISSQVTKISKGIKSYLISGGCDLEGAVPLKNHLDALKKLSLGYRLVAHTGLIKKEDVPLVSPYIYAASFNFIGDDSTIKEVYNLNKTTFDFIESYKALKSTVKTFPHITIGLHHGRVKGEYNAIDILSKLGASALVFNVFIPTSGTELKDAAPPHIDTVIDVMSYAKERMNRTDIYLGCMRPGGYYRGKLDELCVKMGVDKIVMPSVGARKYAKGNGYEILESQECCVI